METPPPPGSSQPRQGPQGIHVKDARNHGYGSHYALTGVTDVDNAEYRAMSLAARCIYHLEIIHEGDEPTVERFVELSGLDEATVRAALAEVRVTRLYRRINHPVHLQPPG